MKSLPNNVPQSQECDNEEQHDNQLGFEPCWHQTWLDIVCLPVTHKHPIEVD